MMLIMFYIEEEGLFMKRATKNSNDKIQDKGTSRASGCGFAQAQISQLSVFPVGESTPDMDNLLLFAACATYF